MQKELPGFWSHFWYIFVILPRFCRLGLFRRKNDENDYKNIDFATFFGPITRLTSHASHKMQAIK
jgi:hypothetical protein